MIGRIPIQDIQPVIDCGDRPAKAAAGETFEISATVFREGHDAVAAGVILTDPAGTRHPLVPMRDHGGDRWSAPVTVDREGDWEFRIEAWSDPIATWLHDAGIKIPMDLDTDLMCHEGARLLARAAKAVQEEGCPGCGHRAALLDLADRMRDETLDPRARLAAAQAYDYAAHPLRELVTRSAARRVRVHRRRALFGSWYEFFPRSEGAVLKQDAAPVSGTFRTAARRLDAIARMGFDVVYLPPIHPIGETGRKGRNNTLKARPQDPGSPWAIGSQDGGHDAIHPDLGTFDDFDAFVRRARELGMEVALDFALQCSPDHPWVKEHPAWFTTRADGSIAYAENPPKKYQDIYPLNFDNDPEGIYAEIKRVLRVWMDHDVRIFRVDNPHTKPVAFWERLLADVHETDPDVLFLSEAFTRPPMMQALARVGFHQSYTYFTWKNSRPELEEYLGELTRETGHFLRPNFFVNTPDILHEYLQHGGEPAFRVRAIIAALTSPAWGVYSGYEICENTPVRPGSEEYLDSEKYQFKPRDWLRAARDHRSIEPLITHLNLLRRAHPALQELRNLRFHHADQADILCFSKSLHGAGSLLAVVNLDPHNTREATVHLDMPALGMGAGDEFIVDDELSGESYLWRAANYVRLDPHVHPAHIFTVRGVRS